MALRATSVRDGPLWMQTIDGAGQTCRGVKRMVGGWAKAGAGAHTEYFLGDLYALY